MDAWISGPFKLNRILLAGVSVTDGGSWSCLRLGESLRLDGNRTMQGDVEVYGLDGRLLGRWKALTLPVDSPLSTLSPVLVHMKALLTGQSRVLDSLMRWESHPNRGWGHCVLVCLILLNSGPGRGPHSWRTCPRRMPSAPDGRWFSRGVWSELRRFQWGRMG